MQIKNYAYSMPHQGNTLQDKPLLSKGSEISLKVSLIAAAILGFAVVGVAAATGLAFHAIVLGAVIGVASLVSLIFFSIIMQSKKKKEDIEAKSLSTPAVEENNLTDRKKEVEFDKLVVEIKVAANRDLYLDENFIENRFHINQKLNELPEENRQVRRNEIQKIINEAYINREFKSKIKITTGDPEEVALLEMWGHLNEDSSAYFDKENLHTQIKAMVTAQLEQKQSTAPSLDDVKKLINSCALRARLSAVGITSELEIEKFQASHFFYKEIQANLYRRCEQNLLKLPEDLHLSANSVTVQNIQKNYQSTQKLAANALINEIFRGLVYPGFKNSEISLAHYQNSLNKDLKNFIEDTFNSRISSDQAQEIFLQEHTPFYKKWQSFLKAGFIQDFQDENKILGVGVCCGICQRLRFAHQKDKNFSLEDFVQEIEKGITSRDRYLQAMHSYNFQILRQAAEMPESLMKKHDYEEEILVFGIKGEKGKDSFNREIIKESLLPDMIDKAELLQQLNGWVQLSLVMESGGHAVLLRVSEEPEHVWFFDPNVGLFAFEGEDRSFEEARALCCEFINELIEANYPDIALLGAFGLMPK